VRLPTDVISSPTHVNLICKVIEKILKFDSRGVFHCVGSEPISRFELACRIADFCHLNKKLVIEVCKFYWEFLENSDFNVALPWKGFLADLVGKDRASSLYQFINTVYKKKNSILSTNTDPLEIANPLIKLAESAG